MMRPFRLLSVLLLLVVAGPVWAKDGESRFVGLDDFLIHYKSWGKAGDPAVILIHGFTLDQSFWSRQVPALAKGHRVIALDSPGHGDSGAPRDIEYTMALYARAVEAVAKDAGVTHAALLGHSMGLPVIHTVARRGVLKVDRVVFVDGAIVEPPADPKARAEQQKFFADMIEGLKSPDYTLVLEQFFQRFTAKVPADEKKRLIAKVHQADQHMVVSTFSHFADADVWAPARYDFPVLGLYAKMSEAGVKEWLAAHYPNNRLVVWDDVDHFPQLEQPKRVNKELVEFLR
ncbi:MAG TPA: alpha/beta hydrolase [Magnetospirillum sp.]|jgi:pimeloyl-ACP methyl ester carboxylesterase|nr:alpha/beta hydrolase [Magnetospirillum sp.]